MKTAAVVLVLLFLFIPVEARGSPLKIAGAMQEFVLREIIKDYEAVSRIKKNTEATRKDLRLLKIGSYDWFWRPKFLQKRTKGYEFEIASEGDTPVARIKF